MNFSILDAQGKVQAQLEEKSVEDACRSWARQCFDEATVEQAVNKARFYVLDEQTKAAHLDPYILCPSGREEECMTKHKHQFRKDLQSGNLYAKRAQPFDSGGQG